MSLSGWRRTILADGVLLASPEGPDNGTIRVRTRNTPLISIATLIAQLRGTMPASARDFKAGPVERIQTNEGEYAALIPISVTVGGRLVTRTVGVIFGDDFFAAVDGAAVDPVAGERVRGVVRRLTKHYSLGLGDNRRRPYVYDVPQGWAGLRIHRGVAWMAPHFPKDHGLIMVFDARPSAVSLDHLQDRMLLEDLSQDFTPGPPQAPVQVVTRSGLRGQITIVTGHLPGGVTRTVHNCALDDGRNLYMLRLESDEANLVTNRGVFMQLVHSVQLLPIRNQSAGSFILWQD
ncbi:MAG: hypothetical protein K8W52_13655 [Deltaproteobacteria bacterium]|nr:hypothetical protein [Deltaproteobacteria bacterium]